MSNELDVTPTTQPVMGSADPLYQRIYGSATEEVAPRRVGFPVLPPFTHYVVKPLKAQTHRTEKNVAARAKVEILEGPGETPGKVVMDNGGIWFVISRDKKDKQGHVVGALTDDEYKKKCDNAVRSMNRIRAAVGFSAAFPQGGLHDAAVDAYCRQFDNARPFIVEIRIESGSDGVQRNRIVWESIAALDEPVVNAKGQPTGKTAHEEAKALIASYNARTPGKGATPVAAAPVAIG